MTEPEHGKRGVQYRLSFKLDGTPAAGETYKRRRRGFNTAMEHAIESGYLDENPLANVKRTGSTGGDVVDPRVLVNAAQGTSLLTAVSYVGSVHRNRGRRLVAFFGCQLYAAMRPAEVVGLREKDCYLPETGWGTLTLRETRPVSGKKWTDSGQRHDKRGLKSREVKADRPVPIPPLLVAMLREHITEFGTAKERQALRQRARWRAGDVQLLEGVAGGKAHRTPTGQDGFPARAPALRPSAYLHHELVERWGPGGRGRPSCGQLPGGHPPPLRGLHRRPRGVEQQERSNRRWGGA